MIVVLYNLDFLKSILKSTLNFIFISIALAVTKYNVKTRFDPPFTQITHGSNIISYIILRTVEIVLVYSQYNKYF